MTIKIFSLNDCEWFAGEALADCIAFARKSGDEGCYGDAEEDGYEVCGEELDKLIFYGEEGANPPPPPISFRGELARRVAAGETFPQMFATTEY